MLFSSASSSAALDLFFEPPKTENRRRSCLVRYGPRISSFFSLYHVRLKGKKARVRLLKSTTRLISVFPMINDPIYYQKFNNNDRPKIFQSFNAPTMLFIASIIKKKKEV